MFRNGISPRRLGLGLSRRGLVQLVHAKDVPEQALFQLLGTQHEHGIATTQHEALQLYTSMVRVNVMDRVFYDAQRQGRISFYMTSLGEEASVVASASGLDSRDEVFSQYREQGVLAWRGFTLDQFANQLFGNAEDAGKGRQMPVHYGSSKLHFQTISSPLATQLPQAAGAAYALKKEGKQIACCYFGEGAASEGDFHAGMNFAATLQCPVLFFCRQNGFAISTPASEQSKGSICHRATGYGMSSIRVDGNDAFAVQAATRHARAHILEHQVPVLIESVSYRVGHHSTSDDSTRYRPIEEIEQWRQRNPLDRLKAFLVKREWLTEEADAQLKQAELDQVILALGRAERKRKPELMQSVFDDVFSERTPALERQASELRAHLQDYPLDDEDEEDEKD